MQPSILDPYLEKNITIKRTQFLHSDIENRGWGNKKYVKSVVVGALDRPSRYSYTKKDRKILYSMGIPAHYNLKEMRKIYSDHERYHFIQALIRTCIKFGLSLDIKIHPAEWNVSYEFLQKLLGEDMGRRNNVRVIAGGSIERIFNDYGLLVLDMISTRVLSRVLYTDLPVVLFVPLNYPVHQEHFLDLEKRVYVTRTENELSEVISSYLRSTLNNKSSKDFYDKYLGRQNEVEALQEIKSIVFNKIK